MRRSLVCALLLALGCHPAPTLDVTLSSSPLVDEDPFAGVDTLELRWLRPGLPVAVEHIGFAATPTFHLTAPVPLAGAQLEIAAVSDGAVVAVGRTPPLAAGARAAVAYVGLVNQFAATPAERPLSSARFGATATALGDGRVLIAGGATRGSPGLPDAASISALLELYDPATGGFSLVASGAFAPRIYHAAVPTADGGVLFVGGLGTFGALDDIVLFDRASGVTPLVGKLPGARYGAATALLPDGSALLVGGYTMPDGMGGGTLAPDAVLLAPDGRATPIALPSPRAFAAAVTLAAGDVLITGGVDAQGPRADALVYSSASRTIAAPAAATGVRPEMLSPRVGHTTSRLHSGDVFVFGGNDGRASVAAAEVWSPDAGGFIDPPIFNLTPRQRHGAVALDDGSVLLVGGELSPQRMAVPSPVRDPLRFLPPPSGAAGQFTADLPLTPSRAEASALRLRDGSVLYVGGAVGDPRTLAGGAQILVPCFGACLAVTP